MRLTVWTKALQLLCESNKLRQQLQISFNPVLRVCWYVYLLSSSIRPSGVEAYFATPVPYMVVSTASNNLPETKVPARFPTQHWCTLDGSQDKLSKLDQFPLFEHLEGGYILSLIFSKAVISGQTISTDTLAWSSIVNIVTLCLTNGHRNWRPSWLSIDGE